TVELQKNRADGDLLQTGSADRLGVPEVDKIGNTPGGGSGPRGHHRSHPAGCLGKDLAAAGVEVLMSTLHAAARHESREEGAGLRLHVGGGDRAWSGRGRDAGENASVAALREGIRAG
ncbi:hypothetical protein SLS62_011444, partial [Diatrype stigma]